MTDDALPRAPPKATLICPSCDFQATVGDWSVAEGPRRRDVTCPACGSVAVSQPVMRLSA